MTLDQELEVTSKPSYKFKIRPFVRPKVKLPGPAHNVSKAPQDRVAVSDQSEEKKKKKPKWTKEMKKARDAATAAGAIPARQAPPMPQERNGLEKSPFNNIPGELRNKIYELVLRAPGRVNLNAPYKNGQGGENHRNRPGNRAWKGKAHFLALLSVSYQVRSEGTAAFYSCNKFLLSTRFGRHGKPLENWDKHGLTASLRPARTWLKHIGEFNRSHLTSLEIDLSIWETSKQAISKDHRGWWTGALRTIAKQLLETGIDAKAVFVQVAVELDIPSFSNAELDEPCCPSSKIDLGHVLIASFKIPVVRDREAAKEAIDKGHQRQLRFMKRHARHAMTGRKPLVGCQIARTLPRFLAELENVRRRMLHAACGADGTDEAAKDAGQAT